MFEFLPMIILAVVALVILLSAVVVGIMIGSRKPAVRPASLEEIFADQILAGKFSEGLLGKYYSSARGKCNNCGGKTARWTFASAQEHLQRPRLVSAIKNQELCAKCIWALAKTVASLKAYSAPVVKLSPANEPKPKDAAAPAPAPAPAPQAVSADKSKDGKDEKKPRSLARYVTKLFVAVGFSIFTIFSLTAALSALVPSEAVRSLGVLGMLYSFGAFVVAAVLGAIAIVLLRQMMK
jgi:hypothetical protein